MPGLKVNQNTARRELLALKQLPTKDMTATQQNIWERLVNPDANGNRLIDIYYDKISDYQRDYLRNVRRFNFFRDEVIPAFKVNPAFGQIGLDHGPEWYHGKITGLATTFTAPKGQKVVTVTED